MRKAVWTPPLDGTVCQPRSRNFIMTHAPSIPATIWYTRCPLPAASGIAQRLRWLHEGFESLGIGVDTIRTSPDRAVRDSHFTHAQPALFREGGPVPPLWTRSLGADTALIGITRTDVAQAVLVRPDSDLESIEGLRGRRLPVPRHATQYVDHARAATLRAYETALSRVGLGLSDVELVEIVEGEYEIKEPPVAVTQTEFPLLEALLDGTVEALTVSGANVQRFIAKHGLRPLPDFESSSTPAIQLHPGAPRAITVNRDLAVHHPQLAARYLAILLRTARWAERNPREAAKVLGQELGLTDEQLFAGFGAGLCRQLFVKLSPEYLADLAEQKAFLLKQGLLRGDFDFAAWVVAGPLAIAESWVQDEELPLAV
jgi:sulfonate transport system substrate-binding protein